MAGKLARQKPGTTKARAPVIEAVIAPEGPRVEGAPGPGASTAPEAGPPDETTPCPRSHIPDARTRKALRDADAGKNLTRYADADDLFRELGIKLGQE